MSMNDLILGEAELDDEENDESFDEDAGDEKRKTNGVNGDLEDSSEEEEDDDDEEAARAVREGFIVDEDEEIEDTKRKRRREKKRRREEQAEEEGLDEEDLDLIGEAHPDFQRPQPTQSRLKRLKRGHGETQERESSRDLAVEIFGSDDEEIGPAPGVDEQRRGQFRYDRGLQGEFDDFIEEDEPEDEDELARQQEEREVARPRDRTIAGVLGAEAAGLDEETEESFKLAFGDGDDYAWALDIEREEEAQEQADQQLELKDVFEQSQLEEKMLTTEDNLIRSTDEPERFQLARKPFKHLILTDEQFKEEAVWISNLLSPKKGLHRELLEPFQRAVGKVLEFFITDEVEVPFIFQHRKDYLIHAVKVPTSPDPFNPDKPDYVVSAEKLLNQNDLWHVLELDLKFRALVDKRNTLQRTYDRLKNIEGVQDKIFEDMIPVAVTMEELSDLQDYLYFQYSSQLKDLDLMNGNGNTRRRPDIQKSLYERVRNGNVYSVVRALGITADQIARNALKEGRKHYTEDPTVLPDELINSPNILDRNFPDGEAVLRAAKLTFAEELVMSPKMRKVMRRQYYTTGVMECFRTEKGLKNIDEQHAYYEFKYLRNQQLQDLAQRPDMYLRMLKAEEEGLIQVKMKLQGFRDFKKRLLNDFASEYFSEIADAWNKIREEVLDMAIAKLDKIIVKGVKETFKTSCEDEIAKACREEFSKKLDQAPYKPRGMSTGTIPRVIALSHGNGEPGKDAVCWVWLEETGHMQENGKFADLHNDEKSKKAFVELVQRRKPDVIAVSGFSPETKRLINDISKIVEDEDLRGMEFEDPDTGEDETRRLEVVVVNDEVARLYRNSPRAVSDHPGLPELARYCVALARYLQDPMKEYAALGKDLVSITFHPAQPLVPQDKVLKQLETALVDMVNLCGVEISEAVADPTYYGNLLQYICGLGPRKASSVLKAINLNGGTVKTRHELVGDPENHKVQVVGPRVWNNCASFLWIDYDRHDANSDYLDNTRVHPEDYDIGRKMAADALELDEEDVKAEVDDGGISAVIKKMIRDDAQEKVNDLILEEYAEQLERNFNQRKRATLETIRAELQQPYEELRRPFNPMTTDEIFTMLTGDTRESLCEGMIVDVKIRKVGNDFILAVLSNGIEGRVSGDEISDDHSIIPTQAYAPNQGVHAKILALNRKLLEAQLSLRQEMIQRPYRKHIDHMRDEWDEEQERDDRDTMKAADNAAGRSGRVISHPLFRNNNASQAEEFLGSQARGDAVIRNSSKGPDHIAVTWKVWDNVYQHIDVLEIDKENDFTIGRTLKIGGKYTYSDLDDLIVNHVKAISRKIDEMTGHEKFQRGSKSDTEQWLTIYTRANPTKSVYAFCLDPKHPGYFYLCFKAGEHAKVNSWPVKVVPQAFELRGNPYPDMKALCNGFKLLFQNMQTAKRR